MAILQGTMSDGTLIPVQADSQGRLVCEGLEGPPGQDGAQGPQGEPGPQGPQGEPGQGITLPPNARNGDVLAWDNGLVWVGGIIPTYPPATGQLIGISQTVGNPYSSYFDPSVINPSGGFDGDLNTMASTTGSTPWANIDLLWTLPSPMSGIWEFYLTQNANNEVENFNSVFINGNEIEAGSGNGWFSVGQRALSSFRFRALNENDAERFVGIKAFKLNGEILIDTSNQTVLTFDSNRDFDRMPIGSTLTQSDGLASGTIFAKDPVANTITLSIWTGTWGPANTGLFCNGEVQAVYSEPLEVHR